VGDFSVGAPRRTQRSTGRLATLVVIVVAVVAASTGGVVVLTISSSTLAVFQSPSRANAALYAAAASSGSFHYSGTSTGTAGGILATGTVSGDSSRTEGIQTVKSNFGDYDVIMVNSVADMKPDLNALETAFGSTASLAVVYANR
jgi:hypothetical protein